jgi:hypothetical protein
VLTKLALFRHGTERASDAIRPSTTQARATELEQAHHARSGRCAGLALPFWANTNREQRASSIPLRKCRHLPCKICSPVEHRE